MLLQIPQQQIAVTENASGGDPLFQDRYMSSPRAKETMARDGGNVSTYANAPWCAVFVSGDADKTIGGIEHMDLVRNDNGDGTITTIEGNTGNGKVGQRVWPPAAQGRGRLR
ncbi:hypothetical protein [Streptosporangium sp. NPDC002721]|uniref:hypothetical protein n=1 Tax=Streptosporangium sp. NPDC002721 TaxID=3366188 RepID=UPI0036A505E1